MRSIAQRVFTRHSQTLPNTQERSNSQPASQNGSGANAHASPQAEGLPCAEGTGLVYSETRGTPLNQAVLDPQQIRLRRLRRAVVTSARLHQEALTNTKTRFRAAMLTLTYSEVAGWKPQHIKEFLRLVRQYLNRRGIKFRYVWVSELQQRGAVHYHIMFWLPRGFCLPKPDKQGWWKHGTTNIQWARNPVSYLAKYASKTHSKGGAMPRGIRLYGIGGLEVGDRRERSHWMLPEYIRDISGQQVEESVQTARDIGTTKRAKGGGWLTPLGEWFPSKYIISSFNPLTIKENPAWA